MTTTSDTLPAAHMDKPSAESLLARVPAAPPAAGQTRITPGQAEIIAKWKKKFSFGLQSQAAKL